MKSLSEVIELKIKELSPSGGKRISDAEFARKLGLPENSNNTVRISKYRKGQNKNPGLDFIMKWYEAFGEHLVSLMLGDSNLKVSNSIEMVPASEFRALQKELESEKKLLASRQKVIDSMERTIELQDDEIKRLRGPQSA